MNQDLKTLLHKFDEDGAYEFPVNFDYETLEIMARAVENHLVSSGLKTTFEGAVYNQDASFSIAIILDDYKKVSSSAVQLPVIRFSNFGFMATLTYIDFMPENISKLIIDVLIKNKFMYVPCDDLKVEYDGVMNDKRTFSTWWIRYFDWL
jgi:hypothetical protein